MPAAYGVIQLTPEPVETRIEPPAPTLPVLSLMPDPELRTILPEIVKLPVPESDAISVSPPNHLKYIPASYAGILFQRIPGAIPIE
jgi:hypothetical protein